MALSSRLVTGKGVGVLGVVFSSLSVIVKGVLGVVVISEGEGLVDVGVEAAENTGVGLLGVEGSIVDPSDDLAEKCFPSSTPFSISPSLFSNSENGFFCLPETPKNPELGPLNALNPPAIAGFAGVVVGVVDTRAGLATPIWEVEPNTDLLVAPS